MQLPKELQPGAQVLFGPRRRCLNEVQLQKELQHIHELVIPWLKGPQ